MCTLWWVDSRYELLFDSMSLNYPMKESIWTWGLYIARLNRFNGNTLWDSSFISVDYRTSRASKRTITAKFFKYYLILYWSFTGVSNPFHGWFFSDCLWFYLKLEDSNYLILLLGFSSNRGCWHDNLPHFWPWPLTDFETGLLPIFLTDLWKMFLK